MSDTSIQVEPIDGPGEGVPVDGLAAHLTGSVGLADQPRDDDLMPDEIAHEVESYQEHAAQRDEHLSDDGQGEDEQQAHNGDKRNVPLGALQSERAKRQQAQAEAEQLRHQLAAHQQQLAQFQAWQQQVAAQQQPAEIPAFVDDPEGHVKALTEQFEQRLANMQGQQDQRQMLEQAAAQIQRDAVQVTPFINEVEPKFKAAHPDYDDAREFVQANIRQQLAAQYPGATLEQVHDLEKIATIGFLRQCQANGIDPCAHVYQRAQALGFQTQARAPAISMKRAPTSLSNLPASGKAPDEQGAMSAKQIASMSNEQFDAFFEQMRAADAPRFGF
ncbi:hypothetical protein [Pseudomonas sp. SIMBA_067]|uniref:hypothetical protein n=1 Tax=Pseudomonas sp. SIMBA_067 TaxID=3085807 RepID=UPI00397E8E67